MESITLRAQRRKVLLGVGLFVLIWFLASLLSAGLVGIGESYWLELLNGATFPAAFSQDAPKKPYSFTFYMILGFRTVVNLGAVLSALYAIYFIYTGQLERWLMDRLNMIQRSSNIALAFELLELLDENGVNVKPDIEDKLIEAAGKFQGTELGEHFEKQRLEAKSAAT